jgi:hypothetical protein
MRVGHEPDEDARLERLGRDHPNVGSESDLHSRYYDFREHPELIEISLKTSFLSRIVPRKRISGL